MLLKKSGLLLILMLIASLTLGAKGTIPSYAMNELDQLVAIDAHEWDFFGYSVDIDGDYAVVGAIGDDPYPYDPATDLGSVYIFKHSGSNWSQTAKLDFSNKNYDDLGFGGSVSISGNTIAVGSGDPRDWNRWTCVYIFEKPEGEWQTTTEADAVLGTSDDQEHTDLGWGHGALSLDGDYLIAGAPFWDNVNEETVGAAYIYEKQYGGWPTTETQRLTASDGEDGDCFGGSVSIDGDYAIVGSNSGAYIFYRGSSGWNQQAKLTRMDTSSFGNPVAISGDYVAVKGTISATGRKAIFIFKRDGTTWTYEANCTPSDNSNPYFGYSLSMHNDYVLVGATHWIIGSHTDSAYLFKRYGNSWIQQAKLFPTESLDDEYYFFGENVAIGGEYLIIGSTGGMDGQSMPAYIFSTSQKVYNTDRDTWHDTIQDAIDNADGGDEIKAYPGIYAENVDYSSMDIDLISAYDTEDPNSYFAQADTRINPTASGPAVTMENLSSSALLKGFTITADSGNGIYCLDSSPAIEWCTLKDNTDSGLKIEIDDDSSNPTVSHCIFDNNSASDGGAVNASCSDVTLENCIFINNTVTGFGGAVYVEESDEGTNITNCTFHNNDSTMNTFGYHLGGGAMYLFWTADVTARNTIFWDNTATADDEIYIYQSELDIDYCDIEGGQNGIGGWNKVVTYGANNINSNPDFVDDYHLDSDSPCINEGYNGLADWDYDMDIEGRIYNTTVDIGSDEYHP